MYCHPWLKTHIDRVRRDRRQVSHVFQTTEGVFVGVDEALGLKDGTMLGQSSVGLRVGMDEG